MELNNNEHQSLLRKRKKERKKKKPGSVLLIGVPLIHISVSSTNRHLPRLIHLTKTPLLPPFPTSTSPFPSRQSHFILLLPSMAAALAFPTCCCCRRPSLRPSAGRRGRRPVARCALPSSEVSEASCDSFLLVARAGWLGCLHWWEPDGWVWGGFLVRGNVGQSVWLVGIELELSYLRCTNTSIAVSLWWRGLVYFTARGTSIQMLMHT